MHYLRVTAAAGVVAAVWLLLVAAAPLPLPTVPASPAASPTRATASSSDSPAPTPPRLTPLPVSVVSQPEKSWLSVDGGLTIGTFLVAVAALVAALVGLFGPEIRYWLRLRPRLVAEIGMHPPDCLRIVSVGATPRGVQLNIPTYYFRLSIRNRGRLRAENVQVMAERLGVFMDGQYQEVNTFLPLNLTWSNVGGTTLPSIGAGLARHCDLCHIQETWGPPYDQFGVLLKFNTEVTPNPVGDDRLPPNMRPGGRYRLKVVISADNMDPREHVAEFRFDGRFDRDESVMFGSTTQPRLMDISVS